MKKIRIKGDKIIKQIIMVIATIFALYPVIWLISIAFKDKKQYLANKYFFSWPLQFTSFESALKGGKFFLWFMNSTVMTIGSVMLCTIIAVLAAYAFAKMQFKGQDLIMNILIFLADIIFS